MNKPKFLDTVTNLNPIPLEKLTLVEPEYRSIPNLPRGQVGTIVEVYDRGEECQYLVEFADPQGCEYAMAVLKADEILALNYELNIV
ncbi:MAG: DUF4926 domain-containing protein [Xenococcaceae cyanobacterium]